MASKNSSSDDKVHVKSFADHQYVADAVDSFPLRGEERTDVPSLSLYPNSIPATFDQLVHQTKVSNAMLNGFDEARRSALLENYQGLCEHFINTRFDAKLLLELWGNENNDAIVGCINNLFADHVLEEIYGWHEFPFSKEELWQMLYYPHLEALVRSFDAEAFWSGEATHTMDILRSGLSDTTWALICKLHDESSFPAKIKGELFRQAIIRFNKHGWKLRDDTKQKDVVVPTTSGLKKITEIFELNPDISVGQLLYVLDLCVDTYYMEDEPETGKYDHYWHARQGRELNKLAQWLDKILERLDIYAECPVEIYPNFNERNT